MTTVLVVDDEATITDLLAEALTDEGYDVVVAGDGSQGLRHLELSCPHLVISDYMMPRLDGIELLQALRSHHGCSRVPFILMSGLPPTDIFKMANQYSAFVKKPFALSEVVKLVSDILRP